LADLLAEVKNSLDRWAGFLTRHDLLNKNKLPKEFDDPAIKKALAVLEVMNFGEEERQAYEDHLKWLRMETSAINKRFAEGEAVGIAKGKAEGKAEKTREIASSMLKKDVDTGLISEVTGLSESEINKLR
jgi:predicted transposase/invertase (TIGR01784 family)